MPDQGQPRIELWLKPADAVSLPSWLDGLSICKAESDEIEVWSRMHPGLTIGRDSTLYILRSGAYTGWVVGGNLNTREANEDYFGPSPWDLRHVE
jgi:hypothetical protein